jgi:hypothetical protein
MIEMRNRLIELIQQATTLYLDYLDSLDQNGLIDTEGRSKFIADHLLANGVIVPPCTTEDTVYWISSDGHIVKSKLATITTVFLTKEEAEKALERSGE